MHRELAGEVGVGGETGEQQVRGCDEGADAFGAELGERAERFLERRGAVVHAGHEVTVEIGEERRVHAALMRQRPGHRGK
jgi:hypothetical protein